MLERICVQFFLCVCVCAQAHAGGPVVSQLPQPARVRALGGAVTAIADPMTGPYVQPASAAYFSDDDWTFVGTGLIGFSSGVMPFFNGFESPLAPKISDLRDATREEPDDVKAMNFSMPMGWYTRHLNIGLVPEYTFDTFFESSGSRLHQTNYFTTTVFMNAAREFGSRNQFSWGMTGKIAYRTGSDHVYLPSQITDAEVGISKSAREGIGIGVDMGGLYTWDFMEDVDWSFGFALINGGDLVFFQKIGLVDSEDSGNPRPVHMQANLGSALHFKDLGPVSVRISGDLKHLTRWGTDFPIFYHFALGAELRFKKWLSLMAGMQGLAWSIGTELRYWLLTLNFTGYQEEMGRKLSTFREKRATLWLLSARFQF